MSKHLFLCAFCIAIMCLGCKEGTSPETPDALKQNPSTPAAVKQPDHIHSQNTLPATNDLNALIVHGNQCMDSGRYPEAIDAYQKALDITPDNVNVRTDMGTCYRRIGQPQRAIEEFEKGLSYQPHHHNALINRGIVLAYDMKDYQGALASWNKFLEIAPESPLAGRIRNEIAKIEAIKN